MRSETSLWPWVWDGLVTLNIMKALTGVSDSYTSDNEHEARYGDARRKKKLRHGRIFKEPREVCQGGVTDRQF